MKPRISLLFGLLLLAPGTVPAQTTVRDVMVRPHAFEIGATVCASGGFDMGSTTATLVRNPAIGADPFPLFSADGRQSASAELGLTIGYVITPRFSVEAFGTLSRPTIRLVISQDQEFSGGEVPQGDLTEYGVGGNVLMHFPALTIGGRVVPFVQAGIGFVWQVAGDTSFERGHLIRAGGGVRYLFASRPGRKPSAGGVRGDVLLLIRNGGLELTSGHHVTASAGGGVFFAF